MVRNPYDSIRAGGPKNYEGVCKDCILRYNCKQMCGEKIIERVFPEVFKDEPILGNGGDKE